MNELNEALLSQIQMLREAYAALNRNDVEGFVKDFDQQIERIEPPEFPQGGTYRGLEAVKEHVSKGRSTWAEGSCEPEQFIVVGDKVVAFIHVRVRLKDLTDWIDSRVADVYTFREGKIIQFRSFADERQAFDWAEVKE